MRKLLYIVLLLLLCNLFACNLKRHKVFWHEKPVPCLKKVVVIGFRPVNPIFKGSSYVRSPISGHTFRGTRVTDKVFNYMTGLLIKHLSEKNIFSIVYPEHVKREFLGLDKSIDNANRKLLLEYLRQIGLTFNADAVILGYVFRWEQREGSDFAASKPASVAFDIHLVGVEKGRVLWSAEFDKTQQSLSENLLDIKTFIKGRGKWMTAEKLANMGITCLIDKIKKTQQGCRK